MYICEDGTAVNNLGDCPLIGGGENTSTIAIPQYQCPDGTVVSRVSDCPDEELDSVTGFHPLA